MASPSACAARTGATLCPARPAAGRLQAQSSRWSFSRRLQAVRSRRQQIAATAAGGDVGSTTAEAATAPSRPWSTHSWLWRGHKIQYATAGCGPPVVLVHGFGASSRHWRQNIGTLADAGYKVYAVDLLGQGGSDKPVLDYTMELWRDQVLDFMDEYVDAPAVVVGNSIGSLAALMVADAAPPGAVAGVALLNCAGGMNNKAVADDWRIKLALPLFWLIDALLLQRPIAERLFNRFRSRDNIRQVLLNVYRNPECVDEELVDLIYTPSCDEGALDAFVSILTGPPGPRPDHLLEKGNITQPLLVLWGDADPFTPADGPIGKFFQALPETLPSARFSWLKNVGHCPHDDDPDSVHAELLPWLATVHASP